jgi:hypothetical protein
VVAFQIAVIITGLPLYLVHWQWGQRTVKQAEEERGATLRHVYLYGNMAAFLTPIAFNVFELVQKIFRGINGIESNAYRPLSTEGAVVHGLVAIIVLGVLWFYHHRILIEDSEIVTSVTGLATIRRFYVLGFSAAGLTLTTMAVIHLIRWLMLQFGSSTSVGNELSALLTDEITRLLVGVPIWLIFWRWAQRLFTGPNVKERNSALRKFYLYGAIFIGSMSAVVYATIILASLFRSLLDLESLGDIRDPLPIIIGMGVLWFYHASVLREDAEQITEVPQQAGVRRLHFYLISAVGLSALLVGLSGNISVVLRSLDTSFGKVLREEFSWYTAAILAGLPVWIIPWRQIQTTVSLPDSRSTDARQSIVRKIYLYFFLFVATMTALSSLVYILFRTISMILGEPAPTLTDLGQAISFTVIAVGVWLYHGNELRNDAKLAKREQASLLEALRVVVIDVGEGLFGKAVVEKIKSEVSDISLKPIILTSGVMETTILEEGQSPIAVQIAQAGLIIAPWVVAAGGSSGVNSSISEAVSNSPARKLLVPTRAENWDWIGVDRWDSDAIVQQTMQAVKQVLAGEKVKAHRPMSLGATIGTVVGVLVLLASLAIPLLIYFSF